MQILTLKEMAAYLQMHEMTLYRLANNKKIPGAFRVGRKWRFFKEVFEKEIVGND